VIAAASIADFAGIILLSLFFSRENAGIGAQVVLLALFTAALALVALALIGFEHSMRVSGVLRALQDTTAQIRVRGAFALIVGLVALAQGLGLEVILGAFAAGAILSLVDPDRAMTHPELRTKLQAVGFGVFIPVFFVSSGLRFDLDALFSSPSTLVRVPSSWPPSCSRAACPRWSTGGSSGASARSSPACCRRPRCRSWWPRPRSAWSSA
jgi:Kef-type K+ transport system membrane component KefB